MPAVLSRVPSPTIAVFRSARSLPQNVWNAFKFNPRDYNIIYSHALKALHDSHESTDEQVWIVCTTGDSLDFVLSCTNHAMGTYPIFITAVHPTSDLTFQFVIPRVHILARALHESVGVERVYSVFAIDMVSRTFADTWSKMTEIGVYVEPYYAAKFTFCTRHSLKARQFTVFPGLSYELRLAVPADTLSVAKLCHGFAAEAKPFVLTIEQAVKEAMLLISNNQLWVHTIQVGDRSPEIASIVAVTRESASIAAITKVFTNPDWRSRRCAERLVRKVTQTLLKTKESVVLYVAHDNPAASKVYNRVGFVGLDEYLPPVDGVDSRLETGFDNNIVKLDSWLELGFDRNIVKLGHW